MKKKIVLRGLIGFPTGMAIGQVLSIISALVYGGGAYTPCVPELARAMGSEIYAVALQAFLCGVVGSGFAASSVIWEIENWSLLKQTGVYFLITSVVMLLVAYFSHWMEHSVKGFLIYFGIFVFIFAVVWVVQLLIGRHYVRRMNENLHQEKNGN